MRDLRADVLVLGGGPGGIAAGCAAAEGGARVIVVDENHEPGGQIWRRDGEKPLPTRALRLIDRADRAGVTFLSETTVVHAVNAKHYLGEGPRGGVRLQADKIVLALGARERFLPFPGWTLPGVTGLGGLQALVKGGLNLTGRRVVLAGTGPLMLAVAESLVSRGAKVQAVVEQTAWRKLVRFGAKIWRYPHKAWQSQQIARKLWQVPFHFSAWPARAEGDGHVERVTIRSVRGDVTIPCDWLGVGFGLEPNIELARFLGCTIEGTRVLTNSLQGTSLEDVYAVGEMTGVGGVDLALVEGEIAGSSATERRDRARKLFRRKSREQSFADRLRRAYRMRDELRTMPDEDTIVCRCEDVTFGEARRYVRPRDAKLKTRCSMGPCQGRVCLAALEFLSGFRIERPRPPFLPVSLGTLAEFTQQADPEASETTA